MGYSQVSRVLFSLALGDGIERLTVYDSGLWIVFPSYMIYVFGQEILEGLAIASGEDPGMSRKSTLAIKDE